MFCPNEILCTHNMLGLKRCSALAFLQSSHPGPLNLPVIELPSSGWLPNFKKLSDLLDAIIDFISTSRVRVLLCAARNDDTCKPSSMHNPSSLKSWSVPMNREPENAKIHRGKTKVLYTYDFWVSSSADLCSPLWQLRPYIKGIMAHRLTSSLHRLSSTSTIAHNMQNPAHRDAWLKKAIEKRITSSKLSTKAMALRKVRSNIDRLFDKSLTDLIRGIRNNKDYEARYIASCIEEIKMELRQESSFVKANAIEKLAYVSAFPLSVLIFT
ncbi:unnamed protein product [Toxocara canis]|uniref:MIF4G domain-containing protein n=1 Tax=Toxocara canis TaxID=6265 RepID=A0A183UQJ3_TOXCA|nr:unnamed protein product [Toxocara canis]